MDLYVDIDNTICRTQYGLPNKYELAQPIFDRIEYINKQYDNGNIITYWTARGNKTHINYEELTEKQLKDWGCKYHYLKFNKPSFDLLIDDKCCSSDEYWKMNIYHSHKKHKPETVEKGWGRETIFVNNDMYCGKILHFNTGAKFSMHYHLKKKETWYVMHGKFQFKYINTKTADIISDILEPGDVITNEVGEPHQVICIEEGDIFEVSTTHYDSDSYRVFKGDSQT
jgi:mannose-6-phosphate isomerase-like protein (cupin superfamily)